MEYWLKLRCSRENLPSSNCNSKEGHKATNEDPIALAQHITEVAQNPSNIFYQYFWKNDVSFCTFTFFLLHPIFFEISKLPLTSLSDFKIVVFNKKKRYF